MKRISKGKKAKEQKVKDAKYSVSLGQIEEMVQKSMESERELIYSKARAEAITIAMVLLFSLPIKVLIDHYWKKSAAAKVPHFADLLLDYYDKWQNDEDGFTTRELAEFVKKAGGIEFDTVDD